MTTDYYCSSCKGTYFAIEHNFKKFIHLKCKVCGSLVLIKAEKFIKEITIQLTLEA